MRTGSERLRRLSQSFAIKLGVAALLFALAPVLLYQRLELAETERNALLLRLAQEQGRLAGEAVLPLLEDFSAHTPQKLGAALRRLAVDQLGIKVLFRPAATAHFLFIASAPRTDDADARALLAQLVAGGLLDRLEESCEGAEPAAALLPRAQGDDEFLTYVSARSVKAGCWAVLTVQPLSALPGGVTGQPFWQTPQLQMAAAIYLVLAVLVLSLFTDVWRGLRRFRQVARTQMRGQTQAAFADQTAVTELVDVAVEIDALVDSQRRTEALLRQVSEENAHALKGPLAVIAQSLEPLQRAVKAEDGRARRAIEVIAASVERLDGLVSATRRMDRAIADLMERPRHKVAWSDLVGRVCQGYARLAEDKAVRIETAIVSGVVVRGSAEMLETLLENLLDNALDFSPAGSALTVTLTAADGWATLAVADAGPGVEPERLTAIFERHLSQRDGGDGASHYGLGLWLVRRNAEAMGGRAWAEAGSDGGLCVRVALPMALRHG